NRRTGFVSRAARETSATSDFPSRSVSGGSRPRTIDMCGWSTKPPRRRISESRLFFFEDRPMIGGLFQALAALVGAVAGAILLDKGVEMATGKGIVERLTGTPLWDWWHVVNDRHI